MNGFDGVHLINLFLVPTKTAQKVPKKTSPKKKPASPPSSDELLAPGGGSAPAAGVPFQGAIGALFAGSGMAPQKADERLELDSEQVLAFRFETEAPVDDILIETSGPGWLFFQAKTNLQFGEQPASEMVKTVEQIVRQWKLCSEGDGSKRWNRPLDKDKDRFVIAVGPGTPQTVASDLSEALSRRREGSGPRHHSGKPQGGLGEVQPLAEGGLEEVLWR